MSTQRIAFSALAAATLTLCATSSFAALDQSITNTFDVKVQVAKACIFTTAKSADIVFDRVDVTTITDKTKSTDIQVKCSKNTAFEIALTPGNNGDTGGSGFMKLAGAATPAADQKINYTLKKNTDGSPWGNTPGVNVLASKGIGADQTFKVDAVIRGASWNVEPGDYIDTVTVTVNY